MSQRGQHEIQSKFARQEISEKTGKRKCTFPHLTKTIYQKLICWIFQVNFVYPSLEGVFSLIYLTQVVEELKIHNNIRSLIKTCIDQYLISIQQLNLSEYKMMSIVCTKLAIETISSEKKTSYSDILLCLPAKDILELDFSDDKITKIESVVQLAINEHLNAETPYTHLEKWFDQISSLEGEVSCDIINIINLSQICFQLIQAQPMYVFLACLMVATQTTSQNKVKLATLIPEKSLNKYEQVLQIMQVLEQAIAQ